MIRYLLLSMLLFTIISCGDTQERSEREGRTITLTDDLTFFDEDGYEISTIQVAIADTPNKRNLGLMDVHNLPADGGMLFIFDDEQTRSFWMANTPLSLDIIYVNADLEIVRIQRNTTPFSHDQLPSDYPAQYVVEVNAGYTAENDIREGMRIQF